MKGNLVFVALEAVARINRGFGKGHGFDLERVLRRGSGDFELNHDEEVKARILVAMGGFYNNDQ